MGVQRRGIDILEDRYALLRLISLNISRGSLSYLQEFKYLKALSSVSPHLLIPELGDQFQSDSIRKCQGVHSRVCLLGPIHAHGSFHYTCSSLLSPQ